MEMIETKKPYRNFPEVFDITRHFNFRQRQNPIDNCSCRAIPIYIISGRRFNSQIVKCDLATLMQEKLDRRGELPVVNVRRNLNQLRTGQIAEYVSPSLQWKITKTVLRNFLYD
jgi:hypothetical protein